MAYSCTDLVDNVLDDMLVRGWIQSTQYSPEDPQAQGKAVLTAIGDADRALCRAADAQQLHVELLDSVETLAAIADQHGALALANIVYWQMAILNDTYIELSPDEAELLWFVRNLPSTDRWWARVQLTIPPSAENRFPRDFHAAGERPSGSLRAADG
ncbi:hypothetical protein BVER_04087 [Candidatus Burkholderia verschuerenii]|uniref:Uncharacterized protein n=1 Tax=Candidatus Burkholderia verschuerenii TaxID=242163 RepID=A0A0L0LYH3_9BURK|nr:hypothetical protein [Candidatus Burkholderia verschuerenii]KND54879.1 hypothetical protein BVER_04087 [Candidatus Burkholderia verschuerenii]